MFIKEYYPIIFISFTLSSMVYTLLIIYYWYIRRFGSSDLHPWSPSYHVNVHCSPNLYLCPASGNPQLHTHRSFLEDKAILTRNQTKSIDRQGKVLQFVLRAFDQSIAMQLFQSIISPDILKSNTKTLWPREQGAG